MSELIGEAIVLTNGDAGRPVAGVPLLLRTILALQRAGVERLTLVGAAEAPSDPRIRLRLAVGEDDRLADGLAHATRPPRRGRISRSARTTSSGKSISVHGSPSTRSNPTSTRASSSG